MGLRGLLKPTNLGFLRWDFVRRQQGSKRGFLFEFYGEGKQQREEAPVVGPSQKGSIPMALRGQNDDARYDSEYTCNSVSFIPFLHCSYWQMKVRGSFIMHLIPDRTSTRLHLLELTAGSTRTHLLIYCIIDATQKGSKGHSPPPPPPPPPCALRQLIQRASDVPSKYTSPLSAP